MPTANDDAPASGRVIDLDASRAARAEAAGVPVVVKLGGREFTLPVELPFLFADHLAEGELRRAFDALLGEQASEFWKLGVTLPDVEAFAEQVTGAYGMAEGDSSASSSS